jgi:hypothetical protein
LLLRIFVDALLAILFTTPMNPESIYQENPERNIKILVTEDEAAHMLSTSKTKFRSDIAGQLKYFPNGNRKLYRPKDLQDHVASNLVEPGE